MPPAKWKCRKCGAENVNGNKFCDNCGTPASEDLTVECPNCGAKLKYGALTCEACGIYSLIDCPRCGATQKPDARYCGICGLALPEDSPSGLMYSLLSFISALITIALWIASKHPETITEEGRAYWNGLLEYLPMIFCSLCVGSGCVALGKGRISGIAGIFMLIVYAFAVAMK